VRNEDGPLVGNKQRGRQRRLGQRHRLAVPFVGSTLAVLSGLGHECYLESADTFEAEVRRFLLAQSQGSDPRRPGVLGGRVVGAIDRARTAGRSGLDALRQYRALCWCPIPDAPASSRPAAPASAMREEPLARVSRSAHGPGTAGVESRPDALSMRSTEPY